MDRNNINMQSKIPNNDIENHRRKNTHIYISSIEDQSENYLYPNGHRITHQMRWFKGSRDRVIANKLAS